MAKKAQPIVLCDTNVLIRAYRQDTQMWDELDQLGMDRIAISVITKGEMLYGMKKKEITKTRTLLNLFKYYPIDKKISHKYTELMFDYRDHHPRVADCLIAATAIVYQVPLFTLNRQDFVFYKALTLYNPIYSH